MDNIIVDSSGNSIFATSGLEYQDPGLQKNFGAVSGLDFPVPGLQKNFDSVHVLDYPDPVLQKSYGDVSGLDYLGPNFQKSYVPGPNMAYPEPTIQKNFGDQEIFYAEEIEVKEEQVTEAASEQQSSVYHSIDIQNEIVIQKDNNEETNSYEQVIKNLNSYSDETQASLKKFKKKKRKRSDSSDEIKQEPAENYGLMPIAQTKSFFGSSLGVSKCNICNKFTKRSCFDDHMREHYQNGNNSEMCASQDNDVKPDPMSLPSVYRCLQCSFVTRVESDLPIHMQSHEKSFNPIACAFCDYTSNNSMDMKNHLDLHSDYKSPPKEKDEQAYKCNLCGYQTLEVNTFKSHLNKHGHEKVYTCPYCDFESDERDRLVCHASTHNDDKPYRCNRCSYASAQKSSLKSHMLTHKSKDSMECSSCDFSTKSKGSFSRHQLLHEKEKPYKCSECEYQTVQKAALKAHLQRHKGEKPFKCPDCDYSSVEKTHLIRHIRIHTGEKPIFCFVCDYRCIQFACLANHMKRHNGTRMHCAFCSFSTTSPDTIINHLRGEHKRSWGKKPINCAKCAFKCFTKENLKAHTQEHEFGAAFETSTNTEARNTLRCDMCDFETSKRKYLKSHRKKEH